MQDDKGPFQSVSSSIAQFQSDLRVDELIERGRTNTGAGGPYKCGGMNERRKRKKSAAAED